MARKKSLPKKLSGVPFGIIGRIGHKINQTIGEGNAQKLKGKVMDLAGTAIKHGVSTYAKKKGYDKVVKNTLGVDIPFGMKKRKSRKKK